MKRIGWSGWLSLLLTIGAQAAEPEPAANYEVVIYGGTACGVVAAVQVAQLGKSVVLIEPSAHLGGMTSGGLARPTSATRTRSAGWRGVYRRIGEKYGQPEAWKFEPHVAEAVMEDLIAEARVPVARTLRLERKTGVAKRGVRIRSITMEGGRRFQGQMFIDATYEGDLLAAADVRYTVGREANALYHETLNGVQLGSTSHQFLKPVDPYVTPGNPASGLLPEIHAGPPGKHGDGDQRVQAYNFRMCLTDVPENRLPFPRPQNYDPRGTRCYCVICGRECSTCWAIISACPTARPTRITMADLPAIISAPIMTIPTATMPRGREFFAITSSISKG